MICLQPYNSRVNGEEYKYDARVYHAEKDWNIIVHVDNANLNTRVFRIEDGTEIELESIDTKQYSTQNDNSDSGSRSLSSKIIGVVRAGATVLDFVTSIIDLVSI